MRRAGQVGLSMVELLVGCAVALIVAAAAASVLAVQLRESRLLLAGTRLDQDLRSAAGIVARDLRRAGYWGRAEAGVALGDAAVVANPYGPASAAAAASDAVRLSYSHDTTENGVLDDAEQVGFRLHAGALQIQLGAANWQTLTDVGTLVVTSFVVTPRSETVSLEAFCALPCAVGSTTCPPRQQVRSFEVALTARAAIDARIVRSLRTGVRVRNDAVIGSCTA